MKKRITREETTILKAIAIMTVIFTHANGKQAFEGIPLLGNSRFTSELCMGGMSIFLILSGYGLYCSYVKKGFNNWWDRKITNIFLPAMMIQIIWFLSFSIYSYVNRKNITISRITLVTDILCISQHNSIDGSMWYLSYLLFCYVVFYFFFRFFKEKIAFPLFVIFWFLLAPIAKSAYMNNWYCISSFMIGVILGKITSTCEI